VSQQLESLKRSGFAGLKGSEATLRLVIDEALVNELVEEAIARRYPALRELRVDFEADNQVKVRVRSTTPFVPIVTLQLEIERVALLDPSPTVRFRIRKRGFSKVIASLLPTLADKLPPDVRLSGENVELDLAALLGRWNLAWILAFLVSLEIETLSEQVHVVLELRA
jgi:hypothetical protein